MPHRRQRYYYPAATWSVILVGLVAGAGATLRKYIPRPPLNAMQSEADPFLKAGATQPIHWRTLSEEAFAEARREGKLIFLYMGQATSHSGQLLDSLGLTDSEIADSIRRSFVPIRVDVVASPYLAAAYDPVRRPRDGWDPACQIWYLDPNGRSYGSLLPVSTNPSAMLQGLPNSIAYNLVIKERTKAIEAGESQRDQARALMQPASDVPRPVDHLRALLQTRDPSSGAWASRFGTRLQAMPLMFLMENAPNEAAKSIDLLATSGMVDWVNGGFFSCARQPGLLQPDFEKSAVINATFAEVFAKAGEADLYRDISLEACRALTSDFMEDGAIMSHRYGDGAANRSKKSSFSPRFLADHIDPETRDFATKFLRLDPSVNPAMLLKVGGVQEYQQSKSSTQNAIKKLRESKKDVPQKFSGQVTASVHGYATARLLTCARLLGDEALKEKAKSLFAKLQAFRTGENDVLRRASGDLEPACLADYLAYADAALQLTLLTGEKGGARDGLRVLRRGLEFFAAGPGVLTYASPECASFLPPNTIVPQVVDNEMESTSGLAIRLAMQYAWICESSLRVDAQDLRDFARESVAQYARVANEVQLGFSGYFRAATLTSSDRYIVVRGKDADRVARDVLRQNPLQFVVAVASSEETKLEVVVGGKAIEFPSLDAIRAVFQVR